MKDALAAEWLKLRTLRSTVAALVTAVALSVGLGVLVAASFRSALDGPARRDHGPLDALFASLYSLTLGQLALVVFGVLVVGNEYSSGTIRSSLVAVPRRSVLYGAKLVTGGAVAAAVSTVTVLATFLAAGAVLGPHGVGLGTGDAPVAVAGAVLYLTLLAVAAMALTTVLRRSSAALTVLLPLLFLSSQGLGNLPAIRHVARWSPDQAGLQLMHLVGPGGEPAYGPLTAVAVLLAWTAAAVAGGWLVLERRDA